MAISLYTQSFGSSKANLSVIIRNSATQLPAVVYNSGGAVLNTIGTATLDGSGNLSVYIDTAMTWSIGVIADVKAENDEAVPLSAAQKAAGAVSLYGATADGTLVAPDGTTTFGTAVKALVSGAWNSRNTIAPLGDSITLRNLQGLAGPNYFYGSDGYLSSGNAQLGWPFEIVGVVGLSGQSSAQILANGLPQILAMSPRPARCPVLAGTNDAVPGGISASAPDATIANLKLIYAGLIAAGIEPEMCTLPPRNDAGMTAAMKRVITQINRWIREYAKANSYICNDFYKRLVNPTIGGTSGWALAADGVGALNDTSADQIHPSDYGGYLMGLEFAANHAWARSSNTRPASPRDAGQMYVSGQAPNPYGGAVPNATMMGTAGTLAGAVTGQLASEWSVQSQSVPAGAGTIVASKVAKSDSFGFWQQIAITGGNAGDNQGQCVIRSDQDYPSAFAQLGPNTWQVGDTVQAVCSFEQDASGWANGGDTNCKVWMRLQFFGSTGAVTDAWCFLDGTATSKARIPSGVLKTPPIAIPTGTTRLYLWLGFRGRGTVRFGDADIFKSVSL